MAPMKGLEVIIYMYLLCSHYFMFGMCTINYSCAQLIMNEEMVLLVACNYKLRLMKIVTVISLEYLYCQLLHL